MITDDAYRAMVERCLELEAEAAELRRRLYKRSERRRRVTAPIAAQMRALRLRGLSVEEIGARLGWGRVTVSRYTKDMER